MSETHKPFDTSTKDLIDLNPLAWVHFLGLPGESAELFDTNLVTVLSDADRILRVSNPDYFALLEVLSGYDAEIPERLLMYRSILRSKRKMRVKSVILLLRESADGEAITGLLADDEINFRYQVVRLWELSAESLLSAPLALLPLVPLTDVSANELPAVVNQIGRRINGIATEAEKSHLWQAASLLMGLKYEKDFIDQILEGVMFDLRDSSVYRAAISEGKAEGKAEGLMLGERNVILRQGRKRFGEPTPQTLVKLETMTSLEQLEELGLRLLEVESWDELLN